MDAKKRVQFLQIEQNNIENNLVDFDAQLENEFQKIFSAGVECQETVGDSIEERVRKLEAEKVARQFSPKPKSLKTNLPREFSRGVDDDIAISLNNNYEGNLSLGVHFTLPNLPNFNTLAYATKMVVDYKSMTKYHSATFLEYFDSDDENGDSNRTFFMDNVGIENEVGVIFLHFDVENQDSRKVFVNTGLVIDGLVYVSQKPISVTIDLVGCSEGDSVLSQVKYLNSATYDISGFMSAQIESGVSKEKVLDTSLTVAPPIIIDPITISPVLREVYFNEEESSLKARIKLKTNQGYFAFRIQGDDNEMCYPLSNMEKAQYHRYGLYGFPKDLTAAVSYLLKDGSPEAFCVLSAIFRENLQEKTEAQKYLDKALEANCKTATIESILNCIEDNVDISGCLQEKIDLLCQENSSVAQFIKGYLIETTEKELSMQAAAFDLYLSAATDNFKPACARLSGLNSKEIAFVSKDELKNWFFESIKRDDLRKFCMGACCFYGWGIEKRRAFGINLLEQAAEQGNVNAQFALFEIYDSDNDYNDKALATKCLEMVVQKRHELSVKLASRYIDGIGCESGSISDQKAIRALELAVQEYDDAVAMNNLGWMYMHGRGCAIDYEKAFELFEMAEKKGSAVAVFHIGELFESGVLEGVDIVRAKKYYTRAAELGCIKAKEKLARCERNSEGLIISTLENLHDKVGVIDKKIQHGFDKTNSKIDKLDANISALHDNIEKLNNNIIKLKDFIDNEVMIRFFQTKAELVQELKEYTNDIEEREMKIAQFIASQIKEINNSVLTNKDIVEEEERYLIGLFGEKTWNGLKNETRASLKSARVLWRACSDIQDENFDYSGICISLTAALEVELKRVLYFGLQRFITSHHGKPSVKPSEWPEELVHNRGYNNGRLITLGSMSYLLGKEEGKQKDGTRGLCSDKLIDCMKIYLQQIKRDDTLDLFQKFQDDFAFECDRIADEYRNPAAHTGVINRKKIEGCYYSVLNNELEASRFDVSKFIGQGTRLLCLLYECVDIEKIEKNEKAKYTDELIRKAFAEIERNERPILFT